MLPKSALQGGAGGLAVGWVDLDLGSSPGWWAATVQGDPSACSKPPVDIKMRVASST